MHHQRTSWMYQCCDRTPGRSNLREERSVCLSVSWLQGETSAHSMGGGWRGDGTVLSIMVGAHSDDIFLSGDQEMKGVV